MLPGALDPSELWQAVAAGHDLISAAPAGRWGLPRELALSPAAERSPDQAWSDRGGYVRGFEQIFDPEGFGLESQEIQALDPLFQWVLHTGREALRDAGISPAYFPRTDIVLGNLSFPSVGASRFAESVWRRAAGDLEAAAIDPRNHFMSGLPARLLARSLGLGGTVFALDAACASSLVALKLACDRLHDRRADAMLAGAVSCADDLFIHIGFCALDALSPSGQSRPFHAQADGLLPAEGAAFVVLRRLSDAVARGENILGVIRGIGLSNDGRGRGLLAPSEEGQIRAIRQAYESSDLDPSSVSLVECHATGTPVGDATELRSLGSVYEGAHEVPIGSLKSNLGHLITAAGMAGLLKVLAAMKAQTRPPTLHVDDPLPGLEGSPFRLLSDAEPWTAEGPRRAALSAFGFGGNNAHLLVEEWLPESPTRQISVPASIDITPPPAIAVVGLAVSAASADDTDSFTRAWLHGGSHLRNRGDGTLAGEAEDIELPLAGLGFPPNDLKQTLPQQLLLLATARKAVATLGTNLPRERTSVHVGMRCDAEIARYGLRWRLGADPTHARASKEVRDSVVPGLQAAGVVGTMPNMTANRINSMLDLGGPSASVSSEELSGLTALELAIRALRAEEVDAAVVAASDLACEPVHEAAIRQLAGDRIPGDAAVVMVLQRLDDARRNGDRVLAVIESPDRIEATRDGIELGSAEGEHPLDLEPQFGHCHAAMGLLQTAAAVLSCHHRALPAVDEKQKPRPWIGSHRDATVTTRSLDGTTARLKLRAEASPSIAENRIDRGLWPADGRPRIWLYRGRDRREVLDRIRQGQHEEPGSSALPEAPVCLTLVAASEEELSQRRDVAVHLLNEPSAPVRPPLPGVYLRDEPIDGELAFVFTGAGAAYPGMGRKLLLAMPELLDRLDQRMAEVASAASWIYETDPGQLTPLRQLWGASFLTQAHAQLSRGVLGLEPAAVLGYSSGESNSLMAMGVWNDLDQLYRDTLSCGLFTHELGGDFAAVGRAWQRDGAWANWLLRTSPSQARKALEGEPHVHLTLISSPQEVAIGGDPEACRRVIDRLGATAYPLGYDLAVHCPEVEVVAEPWLELHRRPTSDVAGVRFYSHSTLTHYQPTEESAARAILGQAVRTLDFPGLVNQAFDDGARIFLEHGPRGRCSGWIRQILEHRGVEADRYLAVPLDQAGEGGIRRVADTVAQLLAAGIEVRWDLFAPSTELIADRRPTLRFAAHWPAVELPPHRTETHEEDPMSLPAKAQLMAPAPALPPILEQTTRHPLDSVDANFGSPDIGPEAPTLQVEEPAIHSAPVMASPAPVITGAPVAVAAAVVEPVPAQPALATVILEGAAELQGRIATAQREFLERQTALHHQFLDVRQRSLQALLGSLPSVNSSVPQVPGPSANPAATPFESAVPAEALPPNRTELAEVEPVAADPDPVPQPAPEPAPAPPALVAEASDLPGPKLSRGDLEILASEEISRVFGPLFEQQDGYRLQTRMPEPPFLLADRVTGIDAEAGSMGVGTIWTETDVSQDSWYLHRGRMPGGLMIEAGQADLLLISWLGVDFLNRGERAYRLLGCELTYRGGLPQPGDTLCYDIHVDGHAQQGDVRLFFFHYDCRIDGEVRLEVRHGQAGFFTEQELAESAGVLWDPATEETPPPGRQDPPRVEPRRASFSREQLVALSEGRVAECMGPGFELAASHTATPTIQSGRMLLLDRITELSPDGGPWQRGYLRAVTSIQPESWIFDGHFKNDPCMPGTLMLEGCLQAMSFYLTALGFTLERDGWRFEPVPDEAYSMRCRGQVTPTSKELIYELFVHELIAGPQPTVVADLLCTVDGLKAFHARRLGLRLVPEWPLSVDRSLLDQPFPGGERPTGRPVAEVDGFRFDYASLLACAWGRPPKPSARCTESSTVLGGWPACPRRPTTSCRGSRRSKARWGSSCRAPCWRPNTMCPPASGTFAKACTRPCPSRCCSKPDCSPVGGWLPISEAHSPPTMTCSSAISTVPAPCWPRSPRPAASCGAGSG